MLKSILIDCHNKGYIVLRTLLISAFLVIQSFAGDRVIIDLDRNYRSDGTNDRWNNLPRSGKITFDEMDKEPKYVITPHNNGYLTLIPSNIAFCKAYVMARNGREIGRLGGRSKLEVKVKKGHKYFILTTYNRMCSQIKVFVP